MTAVLPRPTATTTEVVGVTAGDGRALDVHHVVGERPSTRGPVLLVHGAGVRADIFRAPETQNVVDALVDAGWDVWLSNWRASIDLAPNHWTLDEAAVYDHPAIVRAVLARTGASTLRAVVHCQGSSSFALSAVAGLLPEVEVVVSNAMSLHPVVPRFSRFKISRVAPVIAPLVPFVDPAWGNGRPPRLVPRLLLDLVGATHRECGNAVCKMVSFTYGAGHPALWSHENLSPATHEWLRHEFGPVPMTFFAQMATSIARGRITPLGMVPGLAADPVGEPPRTDARFALIAGDRNLCFLAESQRRTFAYLDAYRPGFHSLHVVPGYGHLDVFMGRYAARDTIPLILAELAR